jgi:formylmethanofuran dehydrogenase subunit E
MIKEKQKNKKHIMKRKKIITEQELEQLGSQFFNGLKEIRLSYLNETDSIEEIKELRAKRNKLFKIGTKIGLTHQEIQDKLIEKSLICIKCNKNKTIAESKIFQDEFFCKECQYESDKEGYQQHCEEYRKQEEINPIRKYCREIRKIAAP